MKFDSQTPIFATCRVVNGKAEFDSDERKEFLLDNLRFCQHEKGLIIHAWVIMNNHIHLVISSKTNEIPNIMRDFKRHVSTRIREQKEIPLGEPWRFWNRGYFPVPLETMRAQIKVIDYIHVNPVKAGIVKKSHAYPWSSAIDYWGKKGKLEIEKLTYYF